MISRLRTSTRLCSKFVSGNCREINTCETDPSYVLSSRKYRKLAVWIPTVRWEMRGDRGEAKNSLLLKRFGNVIHNNRFLFILKLVQIPAILPVFSSTAKRSFSNSKFIKTHLADTIWQKRLNLRWSYVPKRSKRDCPFFYHHVPSSRKISKGMHFIPFLEEGPVLVPLFLKNYIREKKEKNGVWNKLQYNNAKNTFLLKF